MRVVCIDMTISNPPSWLIYALSEGYGKPSVGNTYKVKSITIDENGNEGYELEEFDYRALGIIGAFKKERFVVLDEFIPNDEFSINPINHPPVSCLRIECYIDLKGLFLWNPKTK